MDVEPDIELGPVGKREDADALARFHSAVKQVPYLGKVVAGFPLSIFSAEGIIPLFCAGAFFVTPGAAKSSIKPAGAERIQQRCGFEQFAAALSSQTKGVSPIIESALVGVYDQSEAQFLRLGIAKLNHLLKLVAGVNVQQRERNRFGMKGLL